MHQIIDTQTGGLLTSIGGPFFVDIYGNTWQKISSMTIFNPITGAVHPFYVIN